MGKYVKEWEKLKEDFEATTGAKRPKETGRDYDSGAAVAKASGITPVLKDVDTALEKKQRLPLEQALNKLMVARSSYVTFLMKEQKQFNPMDDGDLPMWTAYKDLYMGIQGIEDKASQEAKTLQEQKSPGQEAIIWFGLEGDLKGTIAAAKKALAPFATLEKKHGVLKKADASVKAAETYTAAAARTKAKEARVALELFKTEAAKCATELDKIAKAITEKKEADAKKAVESFHNAMKALSTLPRVDAQIKNLKSMEAKVS